MSWLSLSSKHHIPSYILRGTFIINDICWSSFTTLSSLSLPSSHLSLSSSLAQSLSPSLSYSLFLRTPLIFKRDLLHKDPATCLPWNSRASSKDFHSIPRRSFHASSIIDDRRRKDDKDDSGDDNDSQDFDLDQYEFDDEIDMLDLSEDAKDSSSSSSAQRQSQSTSQGDLDSLSSEDAHDLVSQLLRSGIEAFQSTSRDNLDADGTGSRVVEPYLPRDLLTAWNPSALALEVWSATEITQCHVFENRLREEENNPIERKVIARVFLDQLNLSTVEKAAVRAIAGQRMEQENILKVVSDRFQKRHENLFQVFKIAPEVIQEAKRAVGSLKEAETKPVQNWTQAVQILATTVAEKYNHDTFRKEQILALSKWMDLDHDYRVNHIKEQELTPDEIFRQEHPEDLIIRGRKNPADNAQPLMDFEQMKKDLAVDEKKDRELVKEPVERLRF